MNSRLDEIQAAILRIKRTHHKKNIVELIAEPYLRDILNLKDGDRLRIEFSKK